MRVDGEDGEAGEAGGEGLQGLNIKHEESIPLQEKRSS